MIEIFISLVVGIVLVLLYPVALLLRILYKKGGYTV